MERSGLAGDGNHNGNDNNRNCNGNGNYPGRGSGRGNAAASRGLHRIARIGSKEGRLIGTGVAVFHYFIPSSTEREKGRQQCRWRPSLQFSSC